MKFQKRLKRIFKSEWIGILADTVTILGFFIAFFWSGESHGDTFLVEKNKTDYNISDDSTIINNNGDTNNFYLQKDSDIEEEKAIDGYSLFMCNANLLRGKLESNAGIKIVSTSSKKITVTHNGSFIPSGNGKVVYDGGNVVVKVDGGGFVNLKHLKIPQKRQASKTELEKNIENEMCEIIARNLDIIVNAVIKCL